MNYPFVGSTVMLYTACWHPEVSGIAEAIAALRRGANGFGPRQGVPHVLVGSNVVMLRVYFIVWIGATFSSDPIWNLMPAYARQKTSAKKR